MTSQAKRPELYQYVDTPQGRKLIINLHDGQTRVWESDARFTAMLAGPQSGKTEFVPPWLHREIYGAGGRPGTARAGEPNDYGVVTANYDLFKLKMLPALLRYFETDRACARLWAGDRILELKDPVTNKFLASRPDDPNMWGRIFLRSAEAKAGLESGTWKAACCDEADHPDFTVDAWEAIQRRLSIYEGRVLITTTLYRWGWVKYDIYDRWAMGDKNYKVIQFESVANPSFSKSEFERQRARMPSWKFNMMMRGQYAKPGGLVYQQFNEDFCVKERDDFDAMDHEHWPVRVGHDFGTDNTAAIFVAVEPGTGVKWIFDTYRGDSLATIPDHVERWKEITKGLSVVRRVGGSPQEEETRYGYKLAGWPIEAPKIKHREPQIARVQALHSQNEIYVLRDLHDYLEEKMSFAYKLDDMFERTADIERESTFHLMAAERYVMSEFNPVPFITHRDRQYIPVQQW